MAMGEKQVTVTVGEDMPDGWHLMERIKQFFSSEKNSDDAFRVCTLSSWHSTCIWPYYTYVLTFGPRQSSKG